MQPGGSVGAGAEHPRPLKEGCSTAARRAHAPHEAPSLALEGLPPCWKRGKISGSYASIVRWHSDTPVTLLAPFREKWGT